MTLKLTPEEKKIHRAEQLKSCMRRYYSKNKEAHKEKCRQVLNERYKNDQEFRLASVIRSKKRNAFNRQFKVLCSIDVF